MPPFSKSKIVALRQCQKRFWLEMHRPGLRNDSAATEASFQVGFQVGDIAQKIYDPDGTAAVIDIKREGFDRAFERTTELLRSASTQAIFEAGFSAGGALSFADIMLPVEKNGKRTWRMVEVKSSTQVKDYHHDDIAVQTFVAQTSGVDLESISLAHIDTSWVCPGNGDYRGLLKEVDLTAEAFSRTSEVKEWIDQAQHIYASPTEPDIATGAHCIMPFECGFFEYCHRDKPKSEYPLEWLPRFSAKKLQNLTEHGIYEMEDVKDGLLNSVQQRVKHHTLNDTVYFDRVSAANELARHKLPAYFLDFETIQFAIPTWKGTRPYEQITFQFSLHTLDTEGQLGHAEFLDLSGENPSEPFAHALIRACGNHGPVFVYNAGFETARIKELALRYPNISEQLLAINARVVDLLPIAREHYYHPSQQGSWSIKKVLPAVVPDLSYSALEGVQDGGMAINVFLEGIHPTTSTERKAQIEQQLLAYCKLDTYAMVRLWQVFSGRTDLTL